MDTILLIWGLGSLATVMFGMAALAFIAGRMGKDAKAPATDKGASTTGRLAGFAILGSIAAFGGLAAMANELNDDDIRPEIREIAAGQLKGTMVNARNSDPVVLIVPGSGATDRDGNGPAIRTDAYKKLAEALIDKRIATVRVDKRGMFGSKEAGNPNDVTPAAYAQDIRAWIDLIKQERGSDCIYLLGHSEGALMVSLAAEGREDVCGLILVAGMGRTMGAVLREQLSSNPANASLLPQAMKAIEDLETGRDVDVSGMHPALMPLFAPQVQGYLKSVISVDPVEAVKRAGKKTLIVQGGRDIQVSPADAALLAQAPNTTLHVIAEMNHVLKTSPEDRSANMMTYMDPSLPLADGLAAEIARFVKDSD